jgi:hypothetical protein
VPGDDRRPGSADADAVHHPPLGDTMADLRGWSDAAVADRLASARLLYWT